MKKLTNLALAVVTLIFAGGCSSYQVVTLRVVRFGCFGVGSQMKYC